jgi:hypothetical protein
LKPTSEIFRLVRVRVLFLWALWRHSTAAFALGHPYSTSMRHAAIDINSQDRKKTAPKERTLSELFFAGLALIRQNVVCGRHAEVNSRFPLRVESRPLPDLAQKRDFASWRLRRQSAARRQPWPYAALL